MGKDQRRRDRKRYLELITRLKKGVRVELGEDEVHAVEHVWLGTGAWSYTTRCGLTQTFPLRRTRGLRMTRRPSRCIVCIGKA